MSTLLRHILSIILILAVVPFTAAQKLESLPGAQVGYIIVNLSNGQTVTSLNASQSFIPASTLKCVTAAAAISTLGADYVYHTDIKYTGAILQDTLYGSLIVDAVGDPSLDASLCNAIATTGLKHIRGSVDIKASEPFVNPTAMVEDIGTDYGVGWSQFNYNNNRALVNDLMLQLPLQYLVDDFVMDLYAAGISIADSTLSPADTTLLLTRRSETLGNLCKHMMTESDNLYAEAIGRALTPSLSLYCALDSISAFVAGIGIKPDQIRMNDMNGLSRTNLISPASMAKLLTAMARNRDYTSCFPIVGRTGTVKRLLKKTRLEGRMALKSGSMTGVLAYAGYKLNTNGRPTHAVVIMVNNALCKQSTVKQSIERWLLKIF